MSEKRWTFRYKDTVKKVPHTDPVIGEGILRTAEHAPKTERSVVTWDKKDDTVCFIHTDVEILGLEFVAENMTITEGYLDYR